jgi:hypothetical protein
MGEATRVHKSMPPLWDRELASALDFYNGLTPMSKGHIDATTRGTFLSLTIDRAMALINRW